MAKSKFVLTEEDILDQEVTVKNDDNLEKQNEEVKEDTSKKECLNCKHLRIRNNKPYCNMKNTGCNYEAIDEKKEAEYIRLDVSGRKEELKILASVKGISVTKYIQKLIDADLKKKENKEKIEKYNKI